MKSSLPGVRLQRLAELAQDQGGVVSRRQLYAEGVTRWELRANLRAHRWRRVGGQGVALHTGPLTVQARWWAAVFEGGPRAHLDGASALVASGLRQFEPATIRVSVPRGAAVRRARGLDIRQTRRWRAEDLAPSGVPRSRPAVAAIRHALWASSAREGATVLTMVVQQGLARAEDLAVALLDVRRDKRRRFVEAVVVDLMGGVQSLGELEFARMCRDRGLPEPSRQVRRRGPNGGYFLDAYFEDWDLVVEIDGIHHTWAGVVVRDALRHNDLTLSGSRVLRLPLLGLRVAPDSFFAQIERALVASGRPVRGGAPAA